LTMPPAYHIAEHTLVQSGFGKWLLPPPSFALRNGIYDVSKRRGVAETREAWACNAGQVVPDEQCKPHAGINPRLL
jgi:hypothetical protein